MRRTLAMIVAGVPAIWLTIPTDCIAGDEEIATPQVIDAICLRQKVLCGNPGLVPLLRRPG